MLGKVKEEIKHGIKAYICSLILRRYEVDGIFPKISLLYTLQAKI